VSEPVETLRQLPPREAITPHLQFRGVEEWEVPVLRLIAEQGAIPLDQFARFLKCDLEHTDIALERLVQGGLAEHEKLLVDEPEWVWLTRRGMKASGTGFLRYQPRPAAFARIRVLNEVRLRVRDRAPAARWISGRTLVQECGVKGHQPNAVVEDDGERHAILIKNGCPQSFEYERQVVEALLPHYDAVIAFCASGMRMDRLHRLAAKNAWPKLIIRPLPEPPE